jgi:hypothetical protein
MADEPKPKERKKRTEPAAEDGTPAAPAKTAGAVKGKKAPPAAAAEPAPAPAPLHTKSVKIPKLQKKDKSRLPRRQKKALQKAAATPSKV